MASGLTLNIPLRELLCGECTANLQPIDQSLNSDTHRYESQIKLPGRAGEEPVTVPLNARSVKYNQDGPNRMWVTGQLDFPCSSCGVPHEVSHQLEAVELFVRNLRKCPQGHPQELRPDVTIEWRDDREGPSAEFFGTLYCPTCDQEETHRVDMEVDGASLAEARILDLDLTADILHPVDAPADAVPLPRELESEPFKDFPMLSFASSVLRRKLEPELGCKPFAGLQGIFVLHYLTDLIPFAQAVLELGLEPEGSIFFYKSRYQYPHRPGVLKWLQGRGFTVRPVEEVSEYIDELEETLEANNPRFIVVEDGGYITPLLHRMDSPLANHVIGAVEQTTKGLRSTEDWGVAAGGAGDLEGLMRFPLISIPDSRIKQKVEPPLIALNIVNCIQSLDHSISIIGMNIALFGLGTIGMEVYARLRDLGALVTGYDLDVSRKTEFRMKGGLLAPTAADAVAGKKLVIGCSGRQSITKDVIANLDHGAYIASGSSDLVEIDRDYLEDRKLKSVRLGIGDRDWEPGRLWSGTRYILPGRPGKEVVLLADGFPVTFWGFAGMPHQGGDLIMTVILLAAADLAARNGAPGRKGAYSNRIERHCVDSLGKTYEIEEEYLRQYFPDTRT